MPLLPPTPENLEFCARELREGRVVAFPTETVYGLGGNALSPAAVELIYTTKARPSYNPLIVHVHSVEQARELTTSWPVAAEKLAALYWPGPLTMVLPRAASIPDAVTAGLDSVAVRMPRHPLALELLRACNLPLAAPSANKSGEVSPTRPEHVLQSLGEAVPVLDGGACEVGIESTVIDLRDEIPVLLRPGIISRSELESVLGKIQLPSTSPEGEAKPSPGMLDRHYAPKATVHIFPTLTDAHFHAVLLGSGQKLGVIAFRPTKLNAEEILLPNTPEGYAKSIYGALRQLDDAGCELILIEDLPRTAAWDALRDRLSRAAKPL